MENTSVTCLRTLAEPLAAISLSHLSSNTRQKLADNDLSANAYPTDCGGIVYVGSPPHRIPTESDLAAIFEVAELAGIIDCEAAVIDGLPVFEMPELAS